ncbi:MAG TPA: hypothetical protein VLX91_16155 [Candidatus Acidoferrales bacterium]|nr:hypothetical protein [Candidatus Acidoferrales bacterium]
MAQFQGAVADSDVALTAFDQNLNTSDWYGIASANHDTKFGSIGINENFHSVLIKGSENLIRDEQNFGAGLKREIFQDIYGIGTIQSNFVSDNRQIGLNSVGASSVLGGLTYSIFSDTLLGELGNKWDRQAGVDNSGLSYIFHGATVFSPLKDSRLFPSISIQGEQIFPRRNYDRAAGVNYSQFFSQGSSINFNGLYSSQLRDFYFSDSALQPIYGVTNNIQDRSENQSLFSAGIVVPVLFFQLTTHGSVGQRQIDFTSRYKLNNNSTNPALNLYDTGIKVLDFDLSGQLTTEVDDDTLSATMAHSERNETHTVINYDTLNSFTQQQIQQQSQLNNIGTRNTLAGEIHLHFGNTSLGMTGLASILHYDTPSILNYDDRDELTNTLALILSRDFNPFFQAALGLEADLIHIVYIESQRSANNNRNFIYRLFPTITFSNSQIRSYNKFEVLANYTVYDYEAFSQVHSYSFRQASFRDSTALDLTSKLTVLFFGDLKLYTRGELYWSSFSEYPLNYFVDRTIWISLFYNSELYRCGIGYKYLALTQYNYTTAASRSFASQQTNSGPTTYLSLNMSHLQLILSGWYQVFWQSLQSPVVYPNFELSARYVL